MERTATAEPVLLVPAGRIKCYIHEGVFRPDTPEEHVRQRVARSLVEVYGYAKKDLHLGFKIKIGSGRKKEVDIAIFPENQDHNQDNIAIIVETKREDIKPSHRAAGIDQLKSYLAACIRARWGLWVGSEVVALEKVIDADQAKKAPFLIATDIPFKGDSDPRRLEFADLVPATEGLSKVFARCHNYIHTNGDLGKERAFFELLKLIFCKMHDEQSSSGSLEFSISPEERRSELSQRKLRDRIGRLFNSVKAAYPYIFPGKGEKIDLDNRCLAYCVAELHKFSLLQTSYDVKGEAYEEIVGVTSRRDQGAFFTPRNVCDMAVEMVLSTYPERKRLELKIIDPACGTGGFLRAALLHLRKIVEKQERRKWRAETFEVRAQAAERLRRICDQNLFGIDKLSELVRAAQMNLAMHGDGSMNVIQENSLLPPGEWKKTARKEIELGTFDVVFTNPPFGSQLSVDDPHILDQFELSTYGSKGQRTSLPPEQLFIERCLDFLRPGGRMAVVLPDSILSNPGLKWIRHWLLERAYIIASVDLPKETFARSKTGTLTSILIIQKFTAEEVRLVRELGAPPTYDVYMAIADSVGWDNRGNPIYVRTPEGEEVLRKVPRLVVSRNAKGEVVELRKEEEEPLIDDQLPRIARLFENWLREQGPQRWENA